MGSQRVGWWVLGSGGWWVRGAGRRCRQGQERERERAGEKEPLRHWASDGRRVKSGQCKWEVSATGQGQCRSLKWPLFVIAVWFRKLLFYYLIRSAHDRRAASGNEINQHQIKDTVVILAIRWRLF